MWHCCHVRVVSILSILAMASAAHAQPDPDPSPAPSSPEPLPREEPTGPCGAPSPMDAGFSYVCSTQRLQTSQLVETYRAFTALRNRDGYTFGVHPMSTLTSLHRRDGIELAVGLVVDRVGELRLSGGPVRAVKDGTADAGGEVGLALIFLRQRWQVGGQVQGVFGVRFDDTKWALGGALIGAYEVVSKDWFAMSIIVRLGVEYYDHQLANDETVSSRAGFGSLGLGFDFYQRPD